MSLQGDSVTYSTIACTNYVLASIGTHILAVALNQKYELRMNQTGTEVRNLPVVFNVYDTKCVNWGIFLAIKIDNIENFK